MFRVIFAFIVDTAFAAVYAVLLMLGLGMTHHFAPVVPALGYGACLIIALLILVWNIIVCFQKGFASAFGED